MTFVAAEPVFFRESRYSQLGLPMFIAVLLVVVAVRMAFAPSHSAAEFVVFPAIAVLGVVLTWYMLASGRATFVVTAEDITYNPRPGRRRAHQHVRPRVIRRTPGSTLSFRIESAGNTDGQPMYRLRLRDDATGDEIPVAPFGRVKVRQACESHGWQFS